MRPIAFASAVAAVLLAAAAPARAGDAAITPFTTAAPGTPPAPWKFATLPRKTPTAFTIAEVDGVRALKVEANDSYGDLVHPLDVAPGAHPTIAWRWRVDKLVDGADLRTRAGDDSPAKLCVSFAFDPAQLSFGERTKLALAHSATGQDVPAETLCYVWDNRLPVDTAMANVFTQRIRVIVLQSGPERLGTWIAQKRDLGADYQRLFGDESGGRMPAISGVEVSADADNTHGHALAWFGDIVLAP
jgi:hypothetical protein